MNSTIAIVGRPNVGKSTLFNRLVRKKQAIVDDMSGVTRDRLYGTGEWNGKEFTVIDTGGFVQSPNDIFEEGIRSQVMTALDEADLLFFMVDVTTGITEEDQQFAKIIRQTGKKTLLVVNKVDNNERRSESYQFYKLGFEELYCISSEHGGGTGDLLDAAAEYQDPGTQEEDEDAVQEHIPSFAILGRPNVGKSTLLNNLLEEERNLVTDIPGTTRDTTKNFFNKFDRKFYLIDTAGLRKKKKVTDDIEYYSVIRAIKAIDQCNVALLVLDAQQGIESQDLKILNIALDKKKGIVILVNKWDLVEKDTATSNKFMEDIRARTAPFTDYPVVFISALHKQRLLKAIDAGLEVYENRRRKIQGSKLNEALAEITRKQAPPSERGRFIKIKYVSQLPKSYPHFKFFSNYPQYIREPYKRYLENALRKRFNFKGVPMSLTFVK